MSEINRTVELIDQLIAEKTKAVNSLIEKGVEADANESFDSIMQKAVEYSPKTFILVDEDGNEVVGTLVDKVTAFNATPNDVREGKNFVSENGPATGTKVIPAYHTKEGYKVIKPGSKMVIPFFDDKYRYTKLQVVVCSFNTTISDSVAAIKIVINDKVYNVNSVEVISNVVVDDSNQSIDLSITNNGDESVLLRYFTSYKEIY